MLRRGRLPLPRRDAPKEHASKLFHGTGGSNASLGSAVEGPGTSAARLRFLRPARGRRERKGATRTFVLGSGGPRSGIETGNGDWEGNLWMRGIDDRHCLGLGENRCLRARVQKREGERKGHPLGPHGSVSRL